MTSRIARRFTLYTLSDGSRLRIPVPKRGRPFVYTAQALRQRRRRHEMTLPKAVA